MPDEKVPTPGKADSVREFIEKFRALRADGKSVDEAFDALDAEFGQFLRDILPNNTVNVINPVEYARLANVAKLLSLMGFSEDEIELQINGRHCLGAVILKSDDMVFDRERLDLLSEVLEDVGAVNMMTTPDGRVRVGFTVHHVLKPL
jgi:hypothetical protein